VTPRPSARTPRRATLADLEAVIALEEACFQPYRRASRASLRRSITSGHQEVWVLDASGAPVRGVVAKGRRESHSLSQAPVPPGSLDALIVLWKFPQRWRVYDVCTHPRSQGQGLGHKLMAFAEARAKSQGAAWMSLEADPKEPGLVSWYERQGYAVVDKLPKYYRNGNAAVRMTKRLA
jgi:ribosomal protein S18 acetylase RimI-like enzyme